MTRRRVPAKPANASYASPALAPGRPLEVFISYTSDLEPESRIVGSVVGRVSTLYGKRYGITLHAVLFKHDIVPSSGDGDAQAEINKSLQNATFFIGLMWVRFGTPTPRASSGMEEEYDLALTCRRNPRLNMSHVAYYFCSRKIEPKQLNISQWTAVTAFQNKVSKDGPYVEFKQKPELERRVREDLENILLEWIDDHEEPDVRLNKGMLVRKVAMKSGSSIEKSNRFINAFQSSIRSEMTRGGKVALVGFGTFGVKERKARKGVNPKTLKAITIPKKKAMFFKPGKALKDAIAKK